MNEAEIARLKESAARALERGELDTALAGFVELERADGQPAWARHAAGIYQRLGRTDEAIAALNRAARGHEKAGDILKSAAACKQALLLDPQNTEALTRLSALRMAQAEVAPTVRVPPPRSASWSNRPPPALEALRLKEMVPGATPMPGRLSAGIFQIPIEDPIEDKDQPLELQLKGDEDDAREPRQVSLDSDGNVVSSSFPAFVPSTEDVLVAAIEHEVREAERAKNALTRSIFFTSLRPDSFSALLVAAKLVELPKGSVLFKQGDRGDTLYVIAEGAVDVVAEGANRHSLAHLKEGDFFGEVALLADQPRNATIVGLQDSLLIAIGRDVVHKLIARDHNFLPVLLRFLRDRLVARILTANPLFAGLSPKESRAITQRFRFLEIDPGTILVQQGKKPDGLLVILAGQAQATRDQGGKLIQLGKLGAGDTVGEIALVSQAFPKDALGSRLRGHLRSVPSATGRSDEADMSLAISTIKTTTKCFALELPAETFTQVVHSEGVAFIRRVIEQRATQVRDILAGKTPYTEGHLKL